MKANDNKEVSVLVGENEHQKNTSERAALLSKVEKFKKPIIFTLMAIVFAGCMYLIFKPSDNKKKVQDVGLNGVVPQATDTGLQPDKQKAYEQEKLEMKEQEKRNALASLSDYWNENNTKAEDVYLSDEDEKEQNAYGMPGHGKGNEMLKNYRSTQEALNTFYDDDRSQTQELRNQIEELKQQLSDKETTQPPANIESQLALMEKSYEMAAKYLPANPGVAEQPKAPGATAPAPITLKERFIAFTPARKNAVSFLYRATTDSAFLTSLNETRNRSFYTAGVSQQEMQPKNSISAVVQETKIITSDSDVKLRLLEPARTSNVVIPVGTTITAKAKFEGNRIQLKVTSIELDGYFVSVDITVYGLDGQQGLSVPYSPEMNAFTEIASNMSQTSGTSIMMTRSAGQQLTGDLSRGVIQGVSGYFSKKIRTPKVTLKAGHQVLLVSK